MQSFLDYSVTIRCFWGTTNRSNTLTQIGTAFVHSVPSANSACITNSGASLFVFGRKTIVTAAALVFIAAGIPISSVAQISRLPRLDATAGDFFGVDVAIDDGRVLVGATGVETCGLNSGAAYIYDLDKESGQWGQTAKLEADDCNEGDYFGRSVSIAGDIAVVSAFRDSFNRNTFNSAYVFERDSLGSWNQVAKLSGNPLSEEGPYAVDVSADTWNDESGTRSRIVVSTSGDLTDGKFSGAVYVYDRAENGAWKRAARLTSPSGTRRGVLGGTVALDKNRLVVGASTYFRKQKGSAFVFDYDTITRKWSESARITGLEDFFISADLEGDRILLGERKAGKKSEGKATVVQLGEDGKWTKDAVLQPSNPFELGAFGSSVALEGDRALVVGYDEQLKFEFNIDRVVYVFERDPETNEWRQRRTIDVGDVHFGSSIDVDSNVAAIGQTADASTSGSVIIVNLH